MTLQYTTHEKLSLRKHPTLNEAWLHDRICDEPSVLGLGDLRVLDRERTLRGGGRLDLLLMDDDNDRRYEVEIQLGATDPSHIIRAIEYWDLERRRYPAYEHIAVIIAEDVTSRFLNVMSLMSGSIPMIDIQLDALKVGEQLLLNFLQVLDLTDLREDDVDDGGDDGGGGGGGPRDRPYWDQRAGKLMPMADELLGIINQHARAPQEFNFLRYYFGLRCNGVVRNVMTFSPKPTKNTINLGMRIHDVQPHLDALEAAGLNVRSRRSHRLSIRLTPEDFKEHRALIEAAIDAAVKESGV